MNWRKDVDGRKRVNRLLMGEMKKLKKNTKKRQGGKDRMTRGG